jgi:hypothetical protein
LSSYNRAQSIDKDFCDPDNIRKYNTFNTKITNSLNLLI